MKMYFLIWLTILPFIFEAVVAQDEWIQLEYISKPNSCLTGERSQPLYITACNEDMASVQNQLWRWDRYGNLRLRNYDASSCAVVSSSGQVKLQPCVPKEQWTCLPFALKTKTGRYLAVNDTNFIVLNLDSNSKGSWRRFGDPSTNICNYTGQIWRKLGRRWSKDASQKIETGLSFVLVRTNYNQVHLIVKDEGKTFMLSTSLNVPSSPVFSVSVGPTGIWALSDGTVDWMSNKKFWQTMDNPIDSSSGIDAGPTGIVYLINGSHICSRIGISDSKPGGTDWNCTVGNAGLLSSGIDGCFFVNGQNITYQPENKTQRTQQFSTPFQNTIEDIDAGLNYELWVVTNNHDVYRRIGTSAQSPCGSYWKLVPGIQLTTISIGIYGPVGILASSNTDQAVILNGMPTSERQQELDRLCNDVCNSTGKPLPCLARFSSVSGNTSELRCFEISNLTDHTQYPATSAVELELPQLKRQLFKRPLYGNKETQMWLDQLCNDPEVNHIQNLQPNVVNYFAHHDGNILSCRNILHEENVTNAQEIHEKLKHLTEASCAEIPLGRSSGMFPTLGFSALYFLTDKLPRFQNGSSGWCSYTNDYLEIDFFFVHKICALKLGGDGQVDRWILWYSRDRKHWSKYRQKLKGKYEETQILPVYIKARYLKLEPAIQYDNNSHCLKLEVYGSSQAFMADSCDYYGKELAATNDSIYIIYPNQGAERQLVHCVGLQNRNSSGVRQFPIHSPDLKLYWDSNSTSLTWQGHCSTCRDLVVNSGGILLPINATTSLGDFRGTCISDPETCLDGLSFEIWLWFAEYDSPSTAKIIILQSGSISSRGIELSITQTNFTFTVYGAKNISECHMQIPNFDKWIHVVGTWIKRTMLAQLFVDNVRSGCADTRTRYAEDDFDDDLKLGPIPKIGEGFVVVQALSIWMRAINDTERQQLFNQTAPNIPDVWSSWSNCTIQCEQKRYRKCPRRECNVEIIETRICYDIYECGLRMDWPLGDKTFSRTCPTCRELVASSALILPMNSTVSLENETHLNGTCLSEPNLCINGLTFGIWIWFAEYDNNTSNEPESTILQSGVESGMTLSATSKNVSFKLFNGENSRACSLRINDFNRWVHVVGRWVKESNCISLHVDNMNGSCTQCSFNSSDPSFYDSRSGNYSNDELVLGPIEKVGGGYVLARNLSIWMRAINESEFDYLVKQTAPNTPDVWSSWSNCTIQCEQKRYRKCLSRECNVEIIETRICYDIYECGLRMDWPLEDKTFSDTCPTCRKLVASSALILPMNSTVSLENETYFNGTCLSEPNLCINGLTFGIWIWFSEYDNNTSNEPESTILQSGVESGITLSATSKNVSFKLFNGENSRACSLRINDFNRWVHVVGRWVKESNYIDLHVDNMNGSCTQYSFNSSDPPFYDSGSGKYGNDELVLGPIEKVGGGYVLARNLSIWMRAINESEFDYLIKQTAPNIPDVWSSWSNCTRQCEQKRYRKCLSRDCNVDIIETRICYDVDDCGLRMDWPLEDKTNLTCPTCRELVASSALILPMNSIVSLKNFGGTCLSEPNLCINGLTFGIWIWFAEYDNNTSNEPPESTILQSGVRSGITLSATSKNVFFRLFNGENSRACSLRINDFNRWVHVVGRWLKESNCINLHVDNNMNGSCTQYSFNSSDPPFYDSRSGKYGNDDLVLGPIEKVGGGYVLARNLSIWMRAINESEFEYLIKQKSPKVPGPWSNWTKCVWPCKQRRSRKCQSSECNVEINETRICYDVPECGLRMQWPLRNTSNLTWEGKCPTCRDLVAISALVLPRNATASLGNFSGQCVSEPDLCVEGLTFEIWLWFAEYDQLWYDGQYFPAGIILQSGIGTSGFEVSAKGRQIAFKLYTGGLLYECSKLAIWKISNTWVHVVGIWRKKWSTIELYINDRNKKNTCIRILVGSGDSGGTNYVDNSGLLLLGPIPRAKQGYVVAQNLSIWMRALKDTELEELFQQVPAVPGDWGNWSKCVQPNCKRERHRKCQDHNTDRCTVGIRERGNCSVCSGPPSNCNEMLHEGHKTSAIYSIHLRPDFRRTIKVFCEQTMLGGGWLVILRRNSGNLKFTQGWEDYKDGFGDLIDEHWIGNENLHQLTRGGNFKLMVYFYDNQKGLISSTSCDFFNVTSSEEGYAWYFKLCKGPASHALSYSSGAKFSTYDRDYDLSKMNCAEKYGGGFWYKNCSKVTFTSPRAEKRFMVSYFTENGSMVEMPAVTMMIKPFQKSYVEMNITIKFVAEKWSEELASDTTHAFFLLAGKIKQNIEAVYRRDGTYISATINSFRQGSVIADITIAYITINHTQIISLLQDLSNGYLNGEMDVSYNYTDVTILNSFVPSERALITKLYNTSSTSFHINWSFSNNAGIQGYRIFYKTLANTDWDVTENNHTEANITGLKRFTMYLVNVLAYSVRGNGVPSLLHNVTTDEWVPEVGPANLTAYWNKTDYTIHVTWSQIPQPLVHGYLTHYVITYSNATFTATKTSRTNSSVLTGLLIFTEYTIKVAGVTRVGTGGNSSVVFRTRGLPLPAPKNLTATNITGSIINVSWTPIPEDPDFDKLVGYRMYYYDQTHVRDTTINVSQTQVNISDVKQNVDYIIRVVGLTVGKREGRDASTSATIKNITGPKWPPVNLSCPGVSPYTISVGWYAYTAVQTGGSLKGYVLSYNVKGNPRKKNISLPSYPPWLTLENLRILTEYEIRVLVYNEKGVSPLANITCKTEEGVPKVILQHFQAHSYVGETFITLSWQHVADNGTRRGYKVLYRKVSDAGSSVTDTDIEGMLSFPADTTTAMVHGLDRYSKYCFRLLVFNQNFDGVPSSSVCAETCRCPRKFYTNWFVQDPYVVTSYSGIFPPLVKRMIHGVCGVCKEHSGTVVVDFKMDGGLGMARKNTSKLVQLVKTTEETQVSFPVVGPKTGLTGRTGCFIPVIDNPSSVFITRKPVVHTIAQLVIGQTLVDTLPLLAFTFVMLLLGAVVIWAVEWTREETTFPKPFHKGVPEGFWWAYVSITTVGYGDKVPNSIAGRFFAIFWTLFGTVLFSLITVALTTALTTTLVVTELKDVMLYASQVAAIEDSLEVQLGLTRGAHVNQGRNFSDVNSILQAVEDGVVDGALIDKLTGARLDALRDPSSVLVVKSIIPQSWTYGIFMTGHAVKLHKQFRKYLRNNAQLVTGLIKNYTQPLKKGAVSTESQDQEQSKGTSQEHIISASSPLFLPLLLWILGVLIFVIIVGLAWQFIYYKHVAIAAKKNKVSAVNESKTEASSIQLFVTDFGKETCQKLRDMKSRHLEELRVLHKLKSHTDVKK